MNFLSPLLSKLSSIHISPPQHPEQLPAVVQTPASRTSANQQDDAKEASEGQMATRQGLGAPDTEQVPGSQEAGSALPTPPSPDMAPVKNAMRLILIDSAGVRRCRVVPGARILDVLKTGVGIGRACMGLPVHAATPAVGSGLNTVGEVCMVPVPDRVVEVPWCPGHVMAPVCLQSRPGVAWQCCPRTALQRAVTGLADEYGLSLRVSFATQFVLLKPIGGKDAPQAPGAWPWTPVSTAGANQSYALDAHASVLDEMCDALSTMGIPVLEWHADASPGQFTIATGHTEVVAAADNLVLTREAVAGVARKHGLFAVFAPRYGNTPAGGCPCFLSLFKGNECVMSTGPAEPDGSGAPPMSETAHHFFGGVLTALPVMLSFTSPATSSYGRLAACCGTRAWGWQHTGTPMSLVHRYTTRGEPPAVQVRLGVTDGASNPYIALTAVIAGGLLGFLLRSPLPKPLDVPVSSMQPHLVPQRGADKLPSSLDEALKLLGGDNQVGKDTLANEMRSMMATLLGQELLTAYTAVRRAEADGCPNTMEICLKY